MTQVLEKKESHENVLDKNLAGKYLTFILEKEEYGVEILKVQEIIQMQKVTPVPGSPRFIRGVINLRGKVIPVVELRKKFSMDIAKDTQKTAIIVMLIRKGDIAMTMGIIIDDVKEVLDVSAESIEETPALGGSVDVGFIMGICKTEGNVKMLLDIEKVLSNSELNVLGTVAK